MTLSILCHRFCSLPPPGFEDDNHLLIGDNLYYIHSSPTTHLLDVVLKLFKPSLHEALSHLQPLQPSFWICVL